MAQHSRRFRGQVASQVRSSLVVSFALVIALLAASCTSASVDNESGPSTTIEDYPDFQTRRLRLLESAPRPVDHSALPPRHLNPEEFPEALVDRYLIVSGGPIPDQIPSIDQPSFEPVDTVDWLADNEPVLALQLGDVNRAYPVQILVWHEIVNDVVDGRPIVVSYCPLCNSAVAFDRALDGQVLDFGTSGALYQSALVMYDRQSETLWTHFDGRAVIGDYVGSELENIPIATVSWGDFRRAHPDGDVLGPAIAGMPYGQNPYGAYEQRDEPLSGFFTGEVDPRVPAMDRVIGLRDGDDNLAITFAELRRERVIHAELNGRPVVVWWREGTASALSDAQIVDGVDVGATGAFYTDRRFRSVLDGFIDETSSSTWDLLGTAVEGVATGEQLDPVSHVDTFWFAWSSYHPDTALIG